MKKQIFLLTIVCACFVLACKKDKFIETSDARLSTSVDSLHFDTVFTSVGSITQFFKVYNNNNQKLRISSVKLAGGSASVFRINADGVPGPEVTGIEVEANDSVYVFVSVNINPSAANLPYVMQDSISITYNGNTKWVQLNAWGQNANFLRNAKLAGTVTWNNTLPYVILGGIRIDTTATLTIQKGTKVYLHADAPFIVDGTLIVQGEKYDSTRVIFTGDRLDNPYREFPASWPGIYFRGNSRNNQLTYAIIKNAYQGIVAEKPSINANPKVILDQCIIDNIYDVGLLGIQSSITANNCLISNCGMNVVFAHGGEYNLNHCTVSTYSNTFLLHKEPTLQVSNFIKENNTFLTANLNATFRNCIFWGESGSVDDEVVVAKQGSTIFNVNFTNCLWRVKTNPSNATLSGIVANMDPEFDTIDIAKKFYSFRLKPTSPAINKGTATSLSIDLDGNPRPVALPDIGAYEKQ